MVRPTAVITPMTRRSARTDISDAPGEAAPAPPAEPAKPEFAPVIRSKIQPPALRADTLTRDRLVRRLDEALASRVVLIVADAGYGKTTLLADFASRSGFRTLWYRLGAADADAVTWANYLVAACREVDPTFGSVTTSLLANAAAGGPPKSAFIESFLGELGRWQEAPTLLVLDDFHEVDRHSEVADIVGRLIDDAPDWLHVVISGRRRPSLALGRLAATAQLAEIGTDDLRFGLTETERLFAESYSQPLDGDVLEQLDRRTRGWAASLQLFHGSIRGRSVAEIRKLASSLSGSTGPLYDYLAEEVLTNLPVEIEALLIRASMLDTVTPEACSALFSREDHPPGPGVVRKWVGEAISLALLNRASETSEASHIHPLLRDFLMRQMELRFSPGEIEAMHLSVANHLRVAEPLMASHHYIEGHRPTAAMECLGASILSTIGSGKWGAASELLERLTGVPGDPSVAAIRARRFIDDGNPAAAERLLSDLDLSLSPPAVRAVVRQTKLTLGWRTANRDLVLQTLADLQEDAETPATLREIAQIFVDGGSFAGIPAPLPILAARLSDMARSQRASGHTFYSAVSFHNACVAYLNSGDVHAAVAAGRAALESFDLLGFEAAERASTHAMVAECLLELGHDDEANVHLAAAFNGREFADVPAELSVVYSNLGFRTRALELVARAETLHIQGKSDVAGISLIESASALTALPRDPHSAINRLSTETFDWALDLGASFYRSAILAQAHLLLGDVHGTLAIASPAIDEARRRGAKRALARLAVLAAIARGDEPEFKSAMSEAASVGRLSLAELADAISTATNLLRADDQIVRKAITDAPQRWLPALRRQLGKGAPSGNAAAALLDQFGEFEDVGRLRAYAKTYRKRGAPSGLGLELARKTSPRLYIRDLGRVMLMIGDRAVSLSAMRRKPAALLMYLVTRPSFNANREQVLDELWPEADPESAANSLNQSLYFLRREIDPWYEDGVSVDYIHFGGDLVWLDPSVVTADSSQFLGEAGRLRLEKAGSESARELIGRYAGHFAPEFEYEEWAMNWRSRLHATLLEVAHTAVEGLVRDGRLTDARDTAVALLEVDPSATDIERRLVWLQWHIGARSASRAQYQHLERVEESEGAVPLPFDDLIGSKPPS